MVHQRVESTQTEQGHIQIVTLKLKPRKKRVTFADDTEDNNHTNTKMSKICCIYKMGKDKSKNKYER